MRNQLALVKLSRTSLKLVKQLHKFCTHLEVWFRLDNIRTCKHFHCSFYYMNRYYRVALCTVPLLNDHHLTVTIHFWKNFCKGLFFTHLTNDTSRHSWIRVYKEDSVVLIIFLGCQQVNTFHNVILLSVVQWSDKLLQNIIVLLLSEAVNDWRIGIEECSLASTILSIADLPLWKS